MQRKQHVKDSKIEAPQNNSLTKYIRYKSPHRQDWRANPTDPYIYISFELKQLKKAYGAEAIAHAALELTSRGADLKQEHVDQIKTLIQNELINRANLPIRFLDTSLSQAEIRKKNVCFVFTQEKSGCELISSGGHKSIKEGQVIPATLPLETDLSKSPAAHYKFLKLTKLENKILGNDEIHYILHEFMHVFGGKHFRQYGKADQPPYSQSMTCLDSVLSYRETCTPVVEAEAKLLGNERISICDKSPRIQGILSKINAAYPPKLGWVDIAAAQEFNLEWKQRNEASNKTERKSNKQPAVSSESKLNTHIDLYLSPIHLPVSSNNIIQTWASNIVESCPSYFPPGNYQFWSSGTTLFANTRATNGTASSLLPSSILKLN